MHQRRCLQGWSVIRVRPVGIVQHRPVVLGRRVMGVTSTHLVSSFLAFGLGLMNYILWPRANAENEASFFIFVVIILGYSALQARLVYKRERDFFWLNPAIHFALIGNFMMFVVGGMVFVLPDDYRSYDGHVTPWMVEWIWLYLFGMIALWTGYWSPWAAELSRWVKTRPFLHRILRPEFRVNMATLWVLLSVGISAHLLRVFLGIYGYSTDHEQASSSQGFSQYLSLASSLVPLVLLIVSIRYFSSLKSTRKGHILLISLVLLSILMGFLSGFKSQVVMPILLVGVGYYVVHQRLAKWVVPVGLALLFAAYAVIEPFRIARKQDYSFESDNLFYITETIVSARAKGGGQSPALNEQIAHFTAAQFPIPLWSRGLEYAATHESMPPTAPRFLYEILVSPALAIVPRFVWSSKPTLIHGAWYYEEVLGGAPGTSVSISAIVYLNFAGGLFAIVLGFFVFGVVQRVMFKGLIAYGAGGLLVFLMMLSSLRVLDVYYAYIITIIRLLPVALLLQYYLLKPTPRSTRHP